ncbi:hypothetical protein SAMN03159341_1205 [Paenibacillus sp. 1_12]|uniref:hypothetical protein n=1 Tax=Paenibacillus sp. 1_12 TaxID=1566278 RepID=UPI0008F41B9D|nr:hypothetical protein [Paenibacillus sp. 1_12]SFM19433.1 hypothetical protein SAMN03159341_1205 [Paenibacillus sp. 1_12]
MKRNDKWSLSAKKWLVAVAVCTSCLLAVAPSAFAGKEGVFVAADSYFTLENAAFTSGKDSTSIQFSLNMHNGSGSDIDFNSYGVRIVDRQGNLFPAQLTSKQNARVTSGKDQEFRFYSEMAAGESPDELVINLFAWDNSQPTFMRSIGDLSISNVVTSMYDASKQILIPMNDLDVSYSKEVQVAIRLGRSYRINENGGSYIYTELFAQNGDKATLTLPNSLQFRLQASDSLKYSGAFIEGSPQSLLPGKLTKLMIRTSVPDNFKMSSTHLDAFYVSAAEEHLLGTLPVSETEIKVPVGSEQPYSLFGSDSSLTIAADKGIAVKQTEGVLLQTTIKIRNDSTAAAVLPALTGSYQFGTGSMEASQEQSVRSGFLSAGQTATVQYSVLLPDGIEPQSVNLVLFENTTSAVNTNSNSNTSNNNTGSGNTNTSGNSGTAGNTATNTNNTDTSSNGGTGGNTNSGSNASGSTGSSSTNNGSSSANSNNNGSSPNTASGSSNVSNNTSANSSSNTTNRSTVKRPVMLFDLSHAEFASNAAIQAKSYEMGTPMSFAANGWLDTNIGVSLMELHIHENSDFGYRTAIAKYKLTNNGSSPITLPTLGTELINGQGLAFAGVRQSTAASQIMPNTSYVVSYSYMLPTTEMGSQLALNVFDPKSSAANKLSVGTYQVAVQNESIDKTISFYPFELSFDAYAITTLYSSNAYNYVLKMDLTVTRQEQVIIDPNFSQLEFELVDGLGRSLGSQTASFTGTQKLITGNQKITFSSIKTEQFENGLTVNVYETISTPNGPAKRLVKQLQQQ